jgi:hypothetical protein
MPQKKLRVRQIWQEETAWCWAAAAEMVLRYYRGGDVHQCELANEIFDRTDCCLDPMPDACNDGILVRDVRRLYNEWSVNATLQSRSVGFSTLRDEIEAERPVEVVYQLRGGFEHAVIVRGYRDDQEGKFVIFNDPDPFREVGELPLEDFKTAEGKGNWWRTWIEIEP